MYILFAPKSWKTNIFLILHVVHAAYMEMTRNVDTECVHVHGYYCWNINNFATQSFDTYNF